MSCESSLAEPMVGGLGVGAAVTGKVIDRYSREEGRSAERGSALTLAVGLLRCLGEGQAGY
jgi:hypothetical protein